MPRMPASDARISPTAHYTSYVWYANDMSHEALTSRLGRVLYHTLAPVNRGYLYLSRNPNLEMTLLARHRVIDHLLARAIEDGRVGQVIEIAAGLSPRGYRFARRYPELVYLEGDLADMAAHKRSALATAGLLGPRHDVLHLDALAGDGPHSLETVDAARLDPTKGTAIITEGLLGYFDRPTVEATWRRFARCLSRFPYGVHYADLFVGGRDNTIAVRAFARLLGAAVRGRVHLHFSGSDDAAETLRRAGFADASLHLPTAFAADVDLPGAERDPLVRIAEATSAAP
jgi:O-methyltransferase involved in polyketide biosynthesis